MAEEDQVVSLKEYFALRIDNLEKTFEQAEKNRDRNLVLQASETERRLESLNGEAGRLAKVLDASVPREVYQAEMKELRSLIEVLNLAGQKWVTQDYLAGVLKEPSTDIKGLVSSRDVSTGKATQTSVIIAYIIAAIGIMFGIINLLR